MIKILCLGDVVGDEGVGYLESGGRLRKLIDSTGASLTVVNGENAARGNGITQEAAERLSACGADVITGGNHTWRRREVFPMLDDGTLLIRPANYPPEAPGVGHLIVQANGVRVLVMNLIGTVFMDPADSPADCAESILRKEAGRYDVSVCDFHGEATSEKLFFARWFDGRISAVFGTHTHVQTADARVLPGGTAFITDAGMCGSQAGILGVRTESVFHKYRVRTPCQFEPAAGDCRLNGVLFEIDEHSGRAVRAESIDA